MDLTITIHSKKTSTKLAAIITAIVLSTLAGQPALKAYGSSSDVGFQDGLSDCRSGTSDALNGHSNAGHHSAAYMQAYNQGLASCNNSGSNNGDSLSSNNQPNNGPSNTKPNCTGATVLGGALGGVVGSIVGPMGTLGGIGAGSTYLKNLCESG